MKKILIILLLWLFPIIVISQHSLLQEEFSNPDFSTPEKIGSHVFNFFHHSCGANFLSDGLSSGLQGLGYALHSRITTTYQYENNYTDYRHWYKRFQRELGIKVSDHYYRFESPDQNGDPTTGSQIDDDYRDFMLNYYEYNAELMDIIMFKPCYPGSNISNYDTQYDGTTANNGYGNITGGTPYSDNGNNNFAYLNSSSSVSDSYNNTYWTYGNWGGSSSSLAQLKCAYRGMLNIFVNHADILFIAMQAPPMVSLSSEAANSCRKFARWLREDWLHQYDPKGTDQFEDYPGKNVVPFDFHNSVAWTGDDAQLDNEYFWFFQAGMPDNAMDNSNPDIIGRSASSTDHPDNWLNQRTATIFCGGTDSYSPPHTGNSAQTYNSWINAVVNRWEKVEAPVPVELVSFSFCLKGNDVALQWTTATESSNLGFEVQRRFANTQEFKKIGFMNGNGTTANSNCYQFMDQKLTPGVYYYRLKQIDYDGSFEYSSSIEVKINLPSRFELKQNFPNPFNASTMISYQLPKISFVNLIIYDLMGRAIRNLVAEKQVAGSHQVIWDGLDEKGLPVNSGVYFYRVCHDGNFSVMRKLIISK